LPFGAEAPERGAVQAASGAQARAVLHDHTVYAGKQAGFEAAAARSGASGRTDVCAAHRLSSVTHAVHIRPFEQILTACVSGCGKPHVSFWWQ